MAHVLIVEDQAPLVRLLTGWLEPEGVSVMTAEGAEQALVLAAEHPPAVAFCDIRLPGGRDGFWLMEQLQRLYPETAAVVTTGLHQFDAAVHGLRAGVVDYVVTPYTRRRLVEALERALAEHATRQARRAGAPGGAREEAGEGTAAGATAALLTVLHAQGGNALVHAQRVADRAAQIASALGLEERAITCIEHAALLGQIDRLDIHVLARRVPLLGAANAIAVAAQERFDGAGFPLGLRGEAIPLGARILAVANAYEELLAGTALRPMTPPEAIATLVGLRAGEFDPAVLRALRRALGVSAMPMSA